MAAEQEARDQVYLSHPPHLVGADRLAQERVGPHLSAIDRKAHQVEDKARNTANEHQQRSRVLIRVLRRGGEWV
eukprot:1876500-Prymnesium_polylepis.1